MIYGTISQLIESFAIAHESSSSSSTATRSSESSSSSPGVSSSSSSSSSESLTVTTSRTVKLFMMCVIHWSSSSASTRRFRRWVSRSKSPDSLQNSSVDWWRPIDLYASSVRSVQRSSPFVHHALNSLAVYGFIIRQKLCYLIIFRFGSAEIKSLPKRFSFLSAKEKAAAPSDVRNANVWQYIS